MGASNACACVVAKEDAIAPPIISSCSSAPAIDYAAPKNIDSWDFNVWEVESSHVDKAAAWILSTKCDMVSNSEKLGAFAQGVCSQYLPNPYHNARHGLDVLHVVWRCGELMPWSKLYRTDEQFALMVAALSHDIGHFGLSNGFLVNMQDELAFHYNDASPLENMHCVKLFRILANEKTNLFSHLSHQDYRNNRKLIIDAILHTDSVHHGKLVRDLHRLHSDNPHIPGTARRRMLVCSFDN